MGINIRAKGQNGEREIVNELESIVRVVLDKLGYELPSGNIIQRNQNQSAVGGNDLTNTFGLSIEVKRQETLSVNSWWKQCETAANRNGEIPVLIFRQNRKQWRIVLYGYIQVDTGKQIKSRIEIDWDTFKYWFYLYVENLIANGYEWRT